MANVNTDAILTRMREVMTTTAGVVKPITADRFQGGLYEGMEEGEESRRNTSNPRYDVRVRELKVHENSPPSLHSLVLYSIGVDVVTQRDMGLNQFTIDADRDDDMASVTQDADVISQPMTVNNNLLATNGGEFTGLVSGCLKYEGSEVTRSAKDNRGVLEAVHHFSGVVAVDR